MEAISLAASVLGVIDLTKKLTQRFADAKQGAVPREFVGLSSRIGMSLQILQPLIMERIADEIMSSFQTRLRGWTERLSHAESLLEERRWFSDPSHLYEELIGVLRGLADETEAAIPLMLNIKQGDTLKRIEYQLNHLRDPLKVREATATSSTADISIAVRRLKDQILPGASAEEEIQRAQQSTSQKHLEEQQKKLHDIRELLHQHMGGFYLARDPMSAPFVITVPHGDDVQTRVKLDTGSRLNWIHSMILEKAGLSYEPVDDAGQFIGAGDDARPFTPLGRVSVTWFSVNPAITVKNQFLVHDGRIPYKILLGANWVYENIMNEPWAEPVLPIRQIISAGESFLALKADWDVLLATSTPAELKTIHQNAVEDGACNEDIKKFQKRQNQAKRAEQRQLKANSRAISAATSTVATPRYRPSPLQSGAPSVLSRRTSAESLSLQQTLSPTVMPFHGTGQPGPSRSGTSQPEVGESSAGSSRTSATRVEWDSVDGAGEGGSRTQQ